MRAPLLLALPVCVAQAAAQDGLQDVPARVIEEIVVTATRRESFLQDTALSVGVLTGRDLAESGAFNFDDYWRQIPALAVADFGPFGTRIAIRGLTGSATARVDEAMTAVYLDDTPLTAPEGLFATPPDFNLVDVNRVEVLRGPQGTLFGASAMGGAVRTITNLPDPAVSTQSFEAILSDTEHGSTNYEVHAVLNQPIVPDTSALRLAAYYRDADGYVDDIGLNENNVNTDETVGFRLSGITRVGENLTLTGRIQYQDLEAGSFNEVDPVGKPEVGLAIEDDYQLALLANEGREEEVTLYNLTVEYSTAWADWVSVTSYFENDFSIALDPGDETNFFFGAYHVAPGTIGYTQEVFTQELRVTSKSAGKLDWLAGLFYLDQEVPRSDLVAAPGFNQHPVCAFLPPFPDAPSPTCSGFPDGEERLIEAEELATREDLGVFGELSYELSERWIGTLGARWYDISKDRKGISSGLFVGGFDVVTDIASDEDGVNAKGSVAYRINEDAMLYVLASQGFRPGGANEATVVELCDVPPTFESDDLWNYELGARTSWLDDRLTLNATAYHIDWSDAQIVVFREDCGLTSVENVGEATSEGIELELEARITEHWDLVASVGYTDATLDEGIPTANAPAGSELPFTPDLTASLATSHRFPAFGDYTGFVRADLQYTGDSHSQLDVDLRMTNPSYTLVNLRGGIENDRWRTTLYVDNVFDEQAQLSCCRLNGEFVINRPRTIGIHVSYRR